MKFFKNKKYEEQFAKAPHKNFVTGHAAFAYLSRDFGLEQNSVEDVFVEGEPIYPNSGFMEKTHIQLCIVNPNCIKGYFNPIVPDSEYDIP